MGQNEREKFHDWWCMHHMRGGMDHGTYSCPMMGTGWSLSWGKVTIRPGDTPESESYMMVNDVHRFDRGSMNEIGRVDRA